MVELEPAGVPWVIFVATVFMLLLTAGFIFALIYNKQRELQLKARQLKELEKSEKKYRGLFENALVGIIRFSYPSFEILEVNKAALRILQATTIEYVRRCFETMPTSDRTLLEKKLSTSGKLDSLQTKLKTAKGYELWIILSAVAFPQEQYAEMILIDVTEKKRLEEVNLRTQRVESIGIFASGVAHDLQNMLVPLKLSVDLLEKRMKDDQQHSIVETIRQGIDHGLEMVRHMLAFVRGTEGKYVPIELADFMRRLSRSVQDHLPRNIQVTVSYQNPPFYILGDPVQLRQVMMNLLNNSCDAMPEGGTISINIDECVLTEEQVLGIMNGKAGHFIKCTVQDSGTGIAPEHLEKIFDPFFTTKEVGKGTGLGLSVVAGIMKGHNGFVDVSSNLGKGTTFNLYFPVSKADGQ